MKKLLLAIIAFSIQNLAAQETDVRRSIDTFFAGLHATDTTLIRTVCHKEMLLQSIQERPEGGILSHESLKEFYTSIASVPKTLKLEERLLDYKIMIDGSMAHVWTPYEFYVNGKMSHSGTNSFTLLKENGPWKIVHIIDTRKPAKKK